MAEGSYRLAQLDPAIRPAAEWAVKVAEYYGVPVTITSGYRSLDAQARLRENFERCVASGRYGQGPDCLYPANRPGDSAHNYRLAFDSVVPEPYMGWWMQVRRYAGFDVRESDPPHAEYPNWRTALGLA